MKPIDIVIPAYKRPEVLDICLQGLLRPELDFYFNQIIITENTAGGKSNVKYIADKYKDAPIIYTSCDFGETFSKSATVNNGLELVEAEFVFFCDQDSWFPLDYFDKILDLHYNWENLLVFTDAFRVDSIDSLDFRRRIPGNDAEWSSFEYIRPLWHMIYVDGNCSCRSKYAKEAKWDSNYRMYGGELRAFGHRIAQACGVVPCIFEYIWYFHIEHYKGDPAYMHVGEPMPRDKIDSGQLKHKLKPVRIRLK